MKEQLTAGILFAGGGGVECGMIDAGIDPVWAVEWNSHNPKLSEALIHAHKRNFPDCQVVAKPVQQVNWRRLPRVKVLWSSPMCSSFSPANQGAEETMEDIEMAMAVCDAIAILTPTYFYLENVAQYRKSVSFDAIASTLKRLGYSVEWSIENFADYGLPQARKRLILRSALGVAVPPLPKKVEKHVGWYEAIADLIPGLPDSNLLPNQQQSVDKYLEKNPPVPLLIDRVGGRGDYKVKPGHLPANTILRSQFTDGNNRNRNRCGDIRLLSAEIKSLTIECVRRLQGFPDWYDLPAEIAIAGSILGYSVPPLFVQKLFKALLERQRQKIQDKSADDIGVVAKAISLWQPWASLVALGLKKYETRCWYTDYRGKLVIQSAKKINNDLREFWNDLRIKLGLEVDLDSLPRGCAIAVCDLVDCIEMTPAFIARQSTTELLVGDWRPGRFAWKLENIEILPNVPIKGQQGLWDVELNSTRQTLEPAAPQASTLSTRHVLGRHALDRYDSPHWFATAIAPYVELGGTIGECCVGGGVLARCLKEMGCTVWTNDINPDVDADYHHDVTCDRAWDELPEADWIFTNPPYGDAAFKIVRNAYQHAKRGVVFLLRTTWDEPCEERAEWLFQHPITRKLTLPRYKFRENKHGKLSVEASTIAAFVWDKQIPVLPSLSIPRDRVPLFHDSASNAPSWDEIIALIKERSRSNVDAIANEARKTNSTNTICLTRDDSRGKNAIPASGSLISAPSHKLKSGDDGATRSLYQWRERKGSVWVTRSKHVPIGKVGRVKEAIASRQPIAEILELL